MRMGVALLILLVVSTIPTTAMSAKSSTIAVEANPLREAYYGDLHLHTTYSFDAYMVYGAQVDPDGAYRFARGEPGEYLDNEVKRSSPPLDFVAVTDHS